MRKNKNKLNKIRSIEINESRIEEITKNSLYL